GSRLAWVDPDRAKGRWEYRTPTGDAIVGEPALAEDLVVVADQSGHFVGLDPATLKAVGPGHALRGSVAPAASPLPFGKGRVLAPLSDGTALLLPLDRVHHPLRKFPSGW